MIQGQITRVLEKQWNDKTFYTIQVDGEYYGLGEAKPKAKPGDTAQFEADKNPKGFWAIKKGTLAITPAPAESVSTAPVVAQVGGKSQGSNEFWANKEAREVKNDHLRSLGAARNTAIEWIKFLTQTESLKLPAKTADKEQALNLLLNNYVELFMSEEIKREAKPGKAQVVEEAQPVPSAANVDNWS